MVKRFFLARRRWDPLLFSSAAAMVAFHTKIDVIILAIFWGIGFYLIVFRHGSIRRLDPVYSLGALAFAASAVALSAINGDLFDDYRWVTYPAYYLGVMPIAVGTVLIRDPLRQFVLGARFGILLACVVGAGLYAFQAERIGFGSNAANAAFSLAFLAVATRFRVDDAPRFLPNSVGWFYLSIVPVLLTGTRIVLLVFAVGLLIDCWKILRRRSLAAGANRYVALIAAAALAAVFYGANTLVLSRIDSTIQEFQALDRDPLTADGGLSIRIVLWKNAIDIIDQHPLVGVGGSNVQDELLSRIPPPWHKKFAAFTYSHNFALDELMQRGFLGLACLLAFYAFVFAYIAKGASRDIVENLIVLYCLLLIFGSLHYLLLVDRHVGLIAVWFMLLVTQKRLLRLRPGGARAEQEGSRD